MVVQAAQLMVAPQTGALGTASVAANVDRTEDAAPPGGARAMSGSAGGMSFESVMASVVQLPAPATQAVAVPARSLAEAVLQLRADTVVIASDDQRGQGPLDELIQLRLPGGTVLPAHSFAERVLRRVPLTLLRPSDLAGGERLNSPLQAAGKRLVGLAISALVLPLPAPR